MLCITYEGNDEVLWNIEQMERNYALKYPAYGIAAIEGVVMVKADGDELNFIIDKFGTSIPLLTDLRETRWFGDAAKFIVGNL